MISPMELSLTTSIFPIAPKCFFVEKKGKSKNFQVLYKRRLFTDDLDFSAKSDFDNAGRLAPVSLVLSPFHHVVHGFQKAFLDFLKTRRPGHTAGIG
jgi:hypothetical protein